MGSNHRIPSLAIAAAALSLGCQQFVDASSGVPSRATSAVLQEQALCGGCLLGPVTVRIPGQRIAADWSLRGEQSADYLMELTSTSATPTSVRVQLDGAIVYDGLIERGRVVHSSLDLSSTSNLSLEATGPVESNLVLLIRSGAALVGRAGGNVRAPVSGASIAVPAGVFEDPGSLVQLYSTPVKAAHYRPLDAWEHHLILPRLTENASVPLAQPLVVSVAATPTAETGTRPAFRVLVEGSREVMYGRASSRSAGHHELALTPDHVDQLRSLSPSNPLRVDLSIEAFPERNASALDPCQALPPLPPGALASDFAPCGGGVLQHEETSPQPAPGGSAIVLVHGWNTDVVDWRDFYEEQGLVCRQNGAPIPCYFPPTICPPVSSCDLPGKRYFASMLAALKVDWPNEPILLYTYESSNAYADVGRDLANALQRERSTSGVADFVLVAHSMGGLVSRSAALELQTQTGTSSLIRSIVTLGTPHNGTDLATDPLALLVSPGLATPGGQSLGIPLARNEGTLLFLSGGDISMDAIVPPLYFASRNLLCRWYGQCLSDGIVPVPSALPPSFFGSVVDHPKFDHYDHSELKNGSTSNIRTEPLYQQLVQDIGASAIFRWKGAPSVPLPGLGDAPVATVGTKMYVLGGSWQTFSGPAAAPFVLSLDPLLGTWTSLVSLCAVDLTCIKGSSAQAVGGRIYLVGGAFLYGQVTDALRVFDPAANQVVGMASMPLAANRPITGVVGNKLLVVACSFSLNTFAGFAYDLASDNWAPISTPPHGHCGGAGGVIGGKFYVAGGTDLGSIETNSLHVYDPATDTWSARAPIVNSHVGGAAVVFKRRLIVVGGASGGRITGRVDAYDPATDAWQPLMPMITPRASLGLGLVGNSVYAVGGLCPSCGAWPLNTVETLRLPP